MCIFAPLLKTNFSTITNFKRNMPAKKNKKIKAAKKPVQKKVALKKVVKKKPAPKPVKSKPAKKAVVKKVAKKIVKKIVKAAPKKVVKKIVKKVVKKVAVKKPVKAAPKAKAVKKEIKKEVKAAPVKVAHKSLAKTILAKTSSKEKIVEKKVEAPKAPEKKHDLQKVIFVKKSEGGKKVNFKVGDYAVYPSHGIGKIVDIEKTTVLGQDFSCYIMYFEKEKLNIKIPMNSAEKIGLRHLISKSQMDEVFVILRSGVKKLKGMWSRRAQEYETKINSGDIILLAEVLRDLTRDIEDSERSYSERIIYETAIHRLANEYSVIYGIDFEEAKAKVINTAKDKLNSEGGKVAQKDEFDEFDIEGEESDEEEDEESEDEDEDEDGDEDEDDDYDDDDDDDAPRKKRKK